MTTKKSRSLRKRKKAESNNSKKLSASSKEKISKSDSSENIKNDQVDKIEKSQSPNNNSSRSSDKAMSDRSARENSPEGFAESTATVESEVKIIQNEVIFNAENSQNIQNDVNTEENENLENSQNDEENEENSENGENEENAENIENTNEEIVENNDKNHFENDESDENVKNPNINDEKNKNDEKIEKIENNENSNQENEMEKDTEEMRNAVKSRISGNPSFSSFPQNQQSQPNQQQNIDQNQNRQINPQNAQFNSQNTQNNQYNPNQNYNAQYDPNQNYVAQYNPNQNYNAQYNQGQNYNAQYNQGQHFNAQSLANLDIQQSGPNEFRAELEVPIDIRNDPRLNFVGMMIGPGGYTQKQMEQSTGCSITVRGKGTARNNMPLDPDREMFVLVKSDRPEKVQSACSIVKELLNNESKRDMLRQQQMAIRNGQINSARPHHYSPAAFMAHGQSTFPQQVNTHRSPFQNAFKRSSLGGEYFAESIIIPTAKAYLLNGENGQLIGQLSQFSGASININPVPGNNMISEVVIQGNDDQIVGARVKMQEYFKNDPNENQGPEPSDHVIVPNAIVGLIIGKSGETIKRFMAESNCKMKVVPQYLTSPKETQRKILLFGNSEQCARAKFIINDLVEKHKTVTVSNEDAAQLLTEIVSVPCGIIGILIGKKGETIKSMSQRSNCKVQVVQYDENQLFPGCVIKNDDLRHVSLKGNSTSIKKAKIEIQAIINEHAHRNNYTAPRLENENGDPYLGLGKKQYEQYLEQMKTHCNMNKEQVHNYYRSVMSEIASEPVDYAVQVQRYLMQAGQGAQNGYYQQQQYGQNYYAFGMQQR